MLAAAPLSQAIVKKEFVNPVLKKPVAGTRVDVVADRITFEGKSKIATATGTVRITYGPYTLIATKVVYDQDGDSFKANGSVELREPNGNILQAETADLHNKFKEGFARHLRALLTNDVTITAEYARRQEGGITIYEHASYTACKDCSTDGGAPLWEITTTKTVHDEKAKNLYHTNPTLKIGGVPVAWLPYASMPDPTVKRRTGFLLPNFSSGSTYGFGVTTPYFLGTRSQCRSDLPSHVDHKARPGGRCGISPAPEIRKLQRSRLWGLSVNRNRTARRHEDGAAR